MTATVVVAITFWAVTTKTDLTICGPIVFVLSSIYIVGGFFVWSFGPSAHLIFSIIGAILFSFYLAYDTQLIVGGKHKQYQLAVDEYILGSVLLYLDIINIFLYLLSAGGDRE